jgi:hypothetical protein
VLRPDHGTGRNEALERIRRLFCDPNTRNERSIKAMGTCAHTATSISDCIRLDETLNSKGRAQLFHLTMYILSAESHLATATAQSIS